MKRLAMMMVAVAMLGITTAAAQSQTLRIGVKGGLNLSEFSLKSSDFDTDNRM